MMAAISRSVLIALVFSGSTVVAQDGYEYRPLSTALSELYGKGDKGYLNSTMIYDPSLRRPAGAADVATSDAPQANRGLELQRGIVLLQLSPNSTRAQIEALTDKYALDVKSVVSEVGLLIAEIGDATPAVASARAELTDAAENETLVSLRGLKETIQQLRREAVVRTAAVNTFLRPLIAGKTTTATGPDRQGNTHFWDWRVGAGSPAVNKIDGNWGQKHVRFPQAWNFSDAIRARGNKHVKVGVLDTGFGTHRDLNFTLSPVTSLKVRDHGTHVTGIISALQANDIGVDGGTPFADVVVCSAATVTSSTSIPGIFPVLSDVIASLVQFIRDTPGLKVINISLGYNWVPNLGRNPNSDDELQDLVKSHGTIMRAIADFAADRGIILVSAAGNDSAPGFPNIRAEFSSPFNWAALNSGISSTPAHNIIVVEAIDRGRVIARFSNVQGCISAPGVNILSTVAFDQLGGSSDSSYAAFNGTSMAAPHVTALIALMYGYNKNLKMNEVLDILDVRANNRPASATPAPTIDAFSALVACQDRSQALKDLADLNADGTVDMSDFTLFKAALLQIEGAPLAGAPQDLNQDGIVAPDPTHPNAPGENVFPRADLNGSGDLSRTQKAKVAGSMLTDLEVMIEAWEDATVSASSLPSKL